MLLYTNLTLEERRRARSERLAASGDHGGNAPVVQEQGPGTLTTHRFLSYAAEPATRRMATDRKGVGRRGWRDRDTGKDDRRGDAGAPPGPEQEAAGGAGAADRDDAGRARRQPDGPRRLAAPAGRTAGH